MKLLGFVALVVGGLMVDALFAWWTGRVLLPSMGLTAPEYWVWFWGLVPGVLFVLLSAAIGFFIKETAR